MDRFLKIRRSDSKEVRQGKKRYNKRLKRALKKKEDLRKQRTRIKIKPVENKQDFRSNKYYKPTIIYNTYIEKFCSKNNIDKWKNKQTSFILDEDFSLFRNPNRVITSLLEMLKSAKTKGQRAMLIYKGSVSFGSLYLIDNMCYEIARKKRWHLGGKLPDSDRELLSNLKSIEPGNFENESANLINAKVPINKARDQIAIQEYMKKTKEITDMVQHALRLRHGDDYQLSPEAYHAINSTIGEQFDNIVLHVPDAEFGTLCGFYDKNKKEITILIFNFGPTIYETLNHEKLPIEMLEDINKVIQNHNSRKYFIGKKEFTEENAITLLALQEGISSKVVFDKSRGQGFIDYIINCFELNSGTKISLISGSTAICIDKKYTPATVNVLGRDRRILALNTDNDIFQKPDSDYVRNLKVFFPGVIIETTIPLA